MLTLAILINIFQDLLKFKGLRFLAINLLLWDTKLLFFAYTNHLCSQHFEWYFSTCINIDQFNFNLYFNKIITAN